MLKHWDNKHFYTSFGPEVFKKKVYKTLVVPILLYAIKIWTLIKKEEKIFSSIDTKYFRRTAGYNLLDHKRNYQILEEFKGKPAKLRRSK